MIRIATLLCTSALALSVACVGSSAKAPASADVIYHGGTIWTGVPGAGRAQALAVLGGDLLIVGGNEEALELAGPETRRVDLAGAFVTPGQPMGIFKDAAMALVAAAIPQPAEADYDRTFDTAQRKPSNTV
jgi:hypothetical protein